MLRNFISFVLAIALTLTVLPSGAALLERRQNCKKLGIFAKLPFPESQFPGDMLIRQSYLLVTRSTAARAFTSQV